MMCRGDFVVVSSDLHTKSTIAYQRNRSAGFTLLELLVVLVLIGIIISFAVLSVGDGGRQERLKQEAERIVSLFNLAGEEAVLRSMELGVVLQPHGYAFVTYGGSGWQPLAGDDLFREHALPDGVELALFMDGLQASLEPPNEEEGAVKPQLWFSSSGERTPFELSLSYREGAALTYRLQGPLLGAVTLQRVEAAL